MISAIMIMFFLALWAYFTITEHLQGYDERLIISAMFGFMNAIIAAFFTAAFIFALYGIYRGIAQ